MRFSRLFAFLACVMLAQPAAATMLAGSSTPIASPDETIGFDEVALSTGTTVTDQFASLGITFGAPGVSYDTSVSARPNFSGPAVLKFSGGAVSILFDHDVTDMSAAITANFGSMTVTSFLDGTQVEAFPWTFPNNTVPANSNNFFGFTGSLFDEVRIDLGGSTSIAMDTLSYTKAAIPTPGTLPLLAIGLGAGLLCRRRRG
jgi:hypothetical protein